MILDDMTLFTNIDHNNVRVNDNLEEVSTHGSLDFPVDVPNLVLSQMYLNLIRWHWHVEFEMIYVLDGKVKALIDEESIILNPGQGIFVNQNVLHSYHQVEGYDGVFFAIVFHPAIIFGYGNSTLTLKYLNPIVENSHMKYLILDEKDPLTSPIMGYMRQIHDQCIRAEFGYEISCKSLFCELWKSLLKVRCDDSVPIVKSRRMMHDEQRIKDAILYIVQNYAEPITLDDIADSIHVSKSECCRCFQRILRQTPFEYLQKFRVFHAAKMIQQQDPSAESISNLALTVGFGNISYFNKVFKRYLHMTPTEFKRQSNKQI